jgi:predicted O-linked N-acetylglucosamine transferase (SPINDLY family)
LLHALDVPELVTDTKEDYEALALALATQPERLAVLKHKIADHRISAPLFNAEKFTRDIEAAYLRLYGAASARTERGALERV